jgi:transcriptional regulator
MRVKAVDIARMTGLSKATVSLALNGKPGISERTRMEVIECKKQLEAGTKVVSNVSQQSRITNGHEIKVLLVSNGLKNIKGAEMDLWTDVNEVFEKNAREKGYTLGIMYVDFATDNIDEMTAECNKDRVAGVIVIGTELQEGDEEKFYEINKPLIIYDCELTTTKYPCVMINNRQGISLALEELFNNGLENVIYLGNTMYMYNYTSRRRGFKEVLERNGKEFRSEYIIPVGSSVEECYEFMITYLQKNKLPDAFIMDSYHVSIGTIRALCELGKKIPEEISLIGVDVLPPYVTGSCKLTSIRVPHSERAYWVMQLLFKEMFEPSSLKSRLYTNCSLIPGDTVKQVKMN